MEIKRDFYLNKLIKHQKNGMVKIVTGVRRCGKSYLLFKLFRDYLIGSGVPTDHIIAIALDDYGNKALQNPDELYQHIKNAVADDGDYYILLDEIQLVADFYSYDEEKQSIVFSNAITIYKNGHKEVYDSILEVLAESELHNHTFFKESINFFEKTGTKIDAFMRLVNSDIDVVSYQTMPTITQFADESCYLYLLSKYQENPDQYGKFVERLTLYFGEDSAIYARYKEALLQNGITLPKHEVRLDWKKARQKAIQQYFNCLFDQKEYCELVRKFLQSIGKEHLLFSELKSVAVPSFENVDESNIVEKYAMQQMYHRLSLYTDDTDIRKTSDCIRFIWDCNLTPRALQRRRQEQHR